MLNKHFTPTKPDMGKRKKNALHMKPIEKNKANQFM